MNRTDALDAAHTPAAIRERLDAGPQHSYLRDFVYGAIDGAVTTFAVVSGVAGAGLPSSVIVILGIANLAADGFSMAASNFLGTRSEEQLRRRTRRMEAEHIDLVPEGEREEVRQIFRTHGFEGRDLERVVNVITSDRDRWIDMMLKEEHGLSLATPSAARAALATFFAFVIVGALPLIPFLVQLATGVSVTFPFGLSAVMTAVGFFGVGALKGRFVDEPWYLSGLETLGVGGLAASLAYIAGVLLSGLA